MKATFYTRTFIMEAKFTTTTYHQGTKAMVVKLQLLQGKRVVVSQCNQSLHCITLIDVMTIVTVVAAMMSTASVCGV